jgi:nucleoside-diphosphate-sugar epimerase
MLDLNPTRSNDLHTVIGAGQIGRQLARLLADAGHRVRIVRRGAPGAAMPGVTWMQGDITDAAFADDACEGAAVVYHCANPPDYHRWDGVLQPLTRAVRGAATRAGARLVVLDNLYMYGRPGGQKLREDTAMEPCSEKGALRKELAEEMLAAHAAGELEVAIGRASDFFGPSTPMSVFGDRLLEALEHDKAIEAFGDVDLLRSYSYTPDVALGLAVLGTQPGAAGQVWHLPVSSHVSSRAFIERFAEAMGRDSKIRVLPRWAVKAVGVFVKPIGAMVEMLYQWEEEFIVDDSKFRAAFGVEPTPLDQAVAETTAAWRARGAAAA